MYICTLLYICTRTIVRQPTAAHRAQNHDSLAELICWLGFRGILVGPNHPITPTPNLPRSFIIYFPQHFPLIPFPATHTSLSNFISPSGFSFFPFFFCFFPPYCPFFLGSVSPFSHFYFLFSLLISFPSLLNAQFLPSLTLIFFFPLIYSTFLTLFSLFLFLLFYWPYSVLF
jgi:hypothetical protein